MPLIKFNFLDFDDIELVRELAPFVRDCISLDGRRKEVAHEIGKAIIRIPRNSANYISGLRHGIFLGG